MQGVLVMRQLAAVLDQLLLRVTERFAVTPHDVMILAWMAQRPGIPASHVAYYSGRKRQSVQKSLERLQERGLVQSFESCVRKRAGGWCFTEKGWALWDQLDRALREQDQRLHTRGVLTKQFIASLEYLMKDLMGAAAAMQNQGLIELPPPERVMESDL